MQFVVNIFPADGNLHWFDTHIKTEIPCPPSVLGLFLSFQLFQKSWKNNGGPNKKHFFEKQLLSIFQSAYTKNHGTGTVLLNVTDFVFESFDNCEIVLLVLLDSNKAFDCANH